jgi:hypothetical protein
MFEIVLECSFIAIAIDCGLDSLAFSLIELPFSGVGCFSANVNAETMLQSVGPAAFEVTVSPPEPAEAFLPTVDVGTLIGVGVGEHFEGVAVEEIVLPHADC